MRRAFCEAVLLGVRRVLGVNWRTWQSHFRVIEMLCFNLALQALGFVISPE
jgi:hypothetical protein